MRGNCRTYREEIADVAEGRASMETVAHVAGCSACAARVETYRRIFAAARLPRESAPADLVASVMAMMPDARRVAVGRRLGGLAPAARRGSGDVQVVVGDEEASVRLLARAEGDGWIVMGRLPAGGWTFDGPPAQIEEDRFSFRAPDLGATGFVLESEARRLEIPPLADLLGDDSLDG